MNRISQLMLAGALVARMADDAGAAQVGAVKIEPVKRLTMLRLVGKVDNVKERTPLAEIAYHVNAISQAENPDGGTFPNFGGEFVGTNLKTGDILSSGQSTLPTVLAKDIESAKGDSAPNVTGRSVIGVEPKEGGGVSYYVEHLISPMRRHVIDLMDAHHAHSAYLAAKASETPAPAPEAAKDGKKG